MMLRFWTKQMLGLSLAITLSSAANAVVQCEQPGNSSGINIVNPPADLPIRYEKQMLLPDEHMEYMGHGHYTALSNSWLAVSSELSPSTNHGFVDLYQFRDGAWQKAKTWKGPGQSPNDTFNKTAVPVALEDDLLVLGDNGALEDKGSVYVYQKSLGGDENWGLLTSFNGSVPDGLFGTQVELDNKTLVISSREGWTPNDFRKGAAYVFEPDQPSPETWTQSARPDVLGGYSSASTLFDIDSSDNQLIATIREELNPPNKVSIWEKEQNTWAHAQEIDFSGSCAVTKAVIDGNTVVVNLTPSDVPTDDKASALVFFERNEAGVWERKFELDTSVYVGDLALQGDRLVAAAIDLDVVAYVLERQPNGSEWQFTEKLMISSGLESPNAAVSISGDHVAIRASRFVPEGVEYQVGAILTYSLKEFAINPGLNDAWVFEDVPRQGILFTVLPESKLIFLAWFTFDTERPGASVTANLGGPGQRWLTAIGPFDDTRALLDIEVTTGGIFDSDAMVPGQSYDGTIQLEFDDCRSGTFTYNIPSLGLSRTVSISRAVDENVARCESWGQTIAK